ncbi:MAG: hypothetical protein N3F07_03405 [Candidatus Micrarchaeota archaeon]|nr:hypothetical protein [Candidatus Micrarchaeota archaeon]
MKGWKERLQESKWMTDADKELFLKFAEDAVARQIGERRIEKYRSDFSSAHKMTGMSLTAMVKDLDGLMGFFLPTLYNRAPTYAQNAY